MTQSRTETEPKTERTADFSPRAVADHATQTTAGVPARRLGSLLRSHRKAAHIAARRAARAAAIKPAALNDIEYGRTRPDGAVLAALLSCYGITLAEFLPPRAPIVVTSSAATSDEVLRDHIAAVRRWRNSARKEQPSFRHHDILALGKALGTDPDEIDRRLIALTGCSPAEAKALRKWLRAALITIPVAAGAVTPVATAATPTSPQTPATTISATTALRGTVKPGSLDITVRAPKLGAVGTDGSIPATESYVITDARGSGAGWSAQATFTSTDATAYTVGETLRNVNGQTELPQTPPLPAQLTSTPTVIAHAAPGTEGMGAFAGELEMSIVSHSDHSSGQLTLTITPPASA